MKAKLKSIIAAALCAVGLTAFAEEPAGSEANPWQVGSPNAADVKAWTNGTGKLVIEGTGAMMDFKSSSSTDRPWLNDKNAITTVEIKSGVTHIGKNAFYGCTKLETVTFAEGSKLEAIGESAFDGCKVLSSITIPASVTSIGKKAFNSCYDSMKKTGLTEVTFAEGSKLETIGESAFNGCKVLSSITIPASVTSIGQSAFSGCSALSSITIPASVTSIGKQAFYGCTKLETVTFAEGSKLETIGESAFYGCNILSSITIQASVTSIGNFAFQYCYALESINIPASVTSFGWAPFNGCTGLEAISVDAGNPVFSSPDGCNAIIETAKNTLIQGCKNTVIPESVKIIGTYAFCNMTTLESIDIPASVTSICSSAFQFCYSLKSVTIPASSVLESLGSNAFGTCKALESINIPASVTSLEDYTFNFCSNLKSVTVNWTAADKIVQINSKVFKDVHEGMTLIVPAGTESLYAAATGWSTYKIVEAYLVSGVAEHGSVSFDKTCFPADSYTAPTETVTVTVTPDEGYQLKSLVWNDGTDHDITKAKSFTMPLACVTVTAVFEEAGPALTVANVTTVTHWPWDGKIDVTCDLTGSGKVQLGAALTTNGVTVCTATAENVTGATEIDLDQVGGVTNGVKFVWNAKSDCPAGFNSTDTKVKVALIAVAPTPTEMSIDIYLEDEPDILEDWDIERFAW